MEAKKEVIPVPETEMFDLEASKKDTFLQKHPPLTDEQKEQAKIDNVQSKKYYNVALNEIEQNLMNFFEKEEAIVTPDGQVIAMIRQVPYWEMVSLVPTPLMDKSLSEEEKRELVKGSEEYQKMVFIMMEKMVSKPEHDKEWWMENATPDFIVVFTESIEKMFSRLENDVGFFPE